MGSYKGVQKFSSMGYKYSYPTYNQGPNCRDRTGRLKAPAPTRCDTCRIIVRHYTSPRWHRRRRTKRSHTRANLVLGRPISLRALRDLAQHHSVPPQQRLLLRQMGGKKTWHGEGWDKSPPWSLWRGARQSRQAHWEEDWQASRRPNHRFPAYDRGGEAPISVIKETRTAAPDRDYTLVQRVQHAVNLARKSAGKVARLQKERDQKVAQWTQYEKDLKESYQRERKRHLHAVQTLEHDIAEALAASETDQRIMQTAADACFLRPPAEQDGSWEALMAEQDDPTVPPFTRDMWEFMQTAMRQRTGDGPSTRPPPQTRNEPDVEMPPAPAPVPMEASQSHPTMRRPPMQTDTMPKGYAAASPGHQFRAEPYPTGSPLPTHMTVEPKETGDNSGVATSAHKPGPHRSPTQALPTRGNIKDTTKAPPEKAPVNGPTFQEKLDARRASATAEAKHSAMQPFRQHAQPVPPIPPEPGPPQGPEPPISIPDEDGPQEPAPFSPGLTKLE